MTASAQEGTRVFIAHCIQCHDPNSEVHAPTPEALSVIPWENIVKSLENGAMKAVGAQIPPADRIAVARYLGKVELNGCPSRRHERSMRRERETEGRSLLDLLANPC